MGDPRFTANGRFAGYGGRRCVHEPRIRFAWCYTCDEWCLAPTGDPARDALAPCAGCTPIPDEPPCDCADRLTAEADRLDSTTGLHTAPDRVNAGKARWAARWLRGEST